MQSLLLIAATLKQLTPLRELLGTGYTLYTATSQDEAYDYLQLTTVDLVLAVCEDHVLPVAACLQRAKALQPQCVTICIASPPTTDLMTADAALPPSDFLLQRPFTGEALQHMLEQAMEKRRLQAELATLREQRRVEAPSVPVQSGGGDLSLARIGHILRNFAKAFSSTFDLQRTLELFLDALSEFLRPSRVAILIGQPGTRTFEVQAYRGLAPKVAEHIRLRMDEGLPYWLATEARMLYRSDVERRQHLPTSMDIQREMDTLKAVVGIPLLASGTLVGILTLGERVTGVPYSEDALEILCSLASHLAVGIQDITLYHTVQTQKVFTEKILRYMSSGLISIGLDERINLCNHRAAEMLGTVWDEVMHQDLRTLPSPLGDMLFETLADGVAYHNQEVVLSAGKVPLQVNTYQVFNQQGDVSGAVMVFDDLTFQKLLSEERRRADQFDFLNRVAGRMAHEIKNPLVSIQTFVELLGEHYDDPEFRDQFCTVVRQDVRTMNDMTEKLVSFASKISYHFMVNDISPALHRLVATLSSAPTGVGAGCVVQHGVAAHDDAWRPAIELTTADRPLPVRYDAEQLHKALLYLTTFLHHGLPDTGHIVIAVQPSRSPQASSPGAWVHITLTGHGCRLSAEEMQQLFDPFCMEHSALVDVGPCVSQKIIEEHGGRLEVRQTNQRDTTFVIALPIAGALVEAQAS